MSHSWYPLPPVRGHGLGAARGSRARREGHKSYKGALAGACRAALLRAVRSLEGRSDPGTSMDAPASLSESLLDAIGPSLQAAGPVLWCFSTVGI